LDSSSSLGLVTLVALLGFNALLTVARQALATARKTRLHQMAEEDRHGAARALKLTEDSTHLVASLQLVVILIHFLAATLVTVMIGPPVMNWLVGLGLGADTSGVVFCLVVIPLAAAITLLFGEMLPTAIAVRRAEGIAIAMTPTLIALVRLLSPISAALLRLSDLLSAPFGNEREVTTFTEEEIMTLVNAGEEEGVIEEEEREMIHSIFQFGDTLVREVMVPRIDIVALEINTPLEAALDAIIAAGHSRIPVYEESIDRIQGVLYAKDLLVLWREGGDRPIAELMRPAHFIPEAKKAVDLLEELQRRRVHIAIVVDEYGGTAGLVTIEDLLEEIVGEIQDEYDIYEEAAFEQVSEDEYIFDARIDLDDLNDMVTSNLSTDTGDTLGGFIFSVLGRVPQSGEAFQADGLQIEILSVTGRRIRKVRVRRLPPMPPEDAHREPEPSPD
jgi:putative hemolysin